MSIEKQRLYNEIDTLPEELTNQVINFIEYLKISYVDTDAPDNIMIKSKKDIKEKSQQGVVGICAISVYAIEEVVNKIDNI